MIRVADGLRGAGVCSGHRFAGVVLAKGTDGEEQREAHECSGLEEGETGDVEDVRVSHGPAEAPRCNERSRDAGETHQAGENTLHGALFVGWNVFRDVGLERGLGDAGKAKEKLGWVPEITAQEMCAEMVAHDLEEAQRHALLKKHGFSVAVCTEH